MTTHKGTWRFAPQVAYCYTRGWIGVEGEGGWNWAYNEQRQDLSQLLALRAGPKTRGSSQGARTSCKPRTSQYPRTHTHRRKEPHALLTDNAAPKTNGRRKDTNTTPSPIAAHPQHCQYFIPAPLKYTPKLTSLRPAKHGPPAPAPAAPWLGYATAAYTQSLLMLHKGPLISYPPALPV